MLLQIYYQMYTIAQKVHRNKEKPQKFITSGAFYLVTRTGFEPAFEFGKRTEYMLFNLKSASFCFQKFSKTNEIFGSKFVVKTLV